MLSAITAIAVKELRLLWRDRQALALLFLMPAFFILVMSVALEGVFDAGTRSHPLQILIVNQDRGEAARDTLEQARSLEGVTLVEAGPTGPWTRDDAEAAIRQGRFHFALLFGPDYSDRIAGAETESSAARSSQDNAPSSDATVALALIVDPAINR
jgi:ABC-2 type transport system permease protein